MAKRRFHKGRYRAKRRFKRKGKRSLVPRVINTLSTYKRWHEGWHLLAITGAGAGATVPFTCLTYPLNFFNHYTNAAGTYGLLPNVDADYTSTFMAYFDMYRVLAMELTYFPNDGVVVWDKAIAQVDTVDHAMLMYYQMDQDDGALITSEAEALVTGNHPRYIAKRNHFRYAQKYNRQFLNASLITTTPATATTMATIEGNAHLFQSMKIGFPNLLQPAAGTTNYYGRIYIRWLVEYKSVRAV